MNNEKVFRNLGIWTIAAIYFLILVGGIVRATGSGMGCPDWPKCFGSWIPPTDLTQLPINYKEIYGAKLKGEVEFNVYKTWTEYLNRLVGVLIGLLVFLTAVSSFITYRKKDRQITKLSIIAFLLVLVEGWLGSKVVSTELHPLMVSIHMILSLVIVFVLLYAVTKSYKGIIVVEEINNIGSISFMLKLAVILTIGQILLGTQVREMVDLVGGNLGDSFRKNWIEHLGGKFYIHAIFSTVIVLINIWIYILIRKHSEDKGLLNKISLILLLVVILEMMSGVLLACFGFPKFAQPIHLTLGLLLVGIQSLMYLVINKEIFFRESVN